jgi:hypothetical protein
MVIVLDAQEADTPLGNPLAPSIPLFAMPVALVVVCVTEGEIAVLIQILGEYEAGLTVLRGLIVTVSEAKGLQVGSSGGRLILA